MRSLANVLGVVVAMGLGYVPVVACSEAAPKKATPDAGSTDPDTDPTYTNPYPSTPAPTTTTPVVPYDAGQPTPTGCDTSLNLTTIQGCNHFIAGARACAENPDLSPYPFTNTRSKDVVTCNGTNATCVEHCPTVCVRMPSGSPDECDRCQGKIDGTYCGIEMGWTTKNSNLLVHCKSGVLQASPGPQLCNACQSSSGQGTSRCL